MGITAKKGSFHVSIHINQYIWYDETINVPYSVFILAMTVQLLRILHFQKSLGDFAPTY